MRLTLGVFNVPLASMSRRGGDLTGRFLKQFPSATRDVIALLTHSAWRGIDRRRLPGDVKETPPERSDQCTPRRSVQF